MPSKDGSTFGGTSTQRKPQQCPEGIRQRTQECPASVGQKERERGRVGWKLMLANNG